MYGTVRHTLRVPFTSTQLLQSAMDPSGAQAGTLGLKVEARTHNALWQEPSPPWLVFDATDQHAMTARLPPRLVHFARGHHAPLKEFA